MRLYFKSNTEKWAAIAIVTGILEWPVWTLLPERIKQLHLSFWRVLLAYSLLTLLALLVAYFTIAMANALLMRLFAREDFANAQKQALQTLVRAGVEGDAIRFHPSDLLEEQAWRSLKKFWREHEP